MIFISMYMYKYKLVRLFNVNICFRGFKIFVNFIILRVFPILHIDYV